MEEKKHVKKLNKRRAKELRKQQKKLENEMAKADSDDEIPFFMQDRMQGVVLHMLLREGANGNTAATPKAHPMGPCEDASIKAAMRERAEEANDMC